MDGNYTWKGEWELRVLKWNIKSLNYLFQKVLSTNPIAFSAPGEKDGMCLDMATSAVAAGKLLYSIAFRCRPYILHFWSPAIITGFVAILEKCRKLIRLFRLIWLIISDLQWRGRLHSYMWMGLGWMDGMVIIGHRQIKCTFGANNSADPNRGFLNAQHSDEQIRSYIREGFKKQISNF